MKKRGKEGMKGRKEGERKRRRKFQGVYTLECRSAHFKEDERRFCHPSPAYCSLAYLNNKASVS